MTGIGLIAGIVLLVIFGPDCLKVLKGPMDFKNLTADDLAKKPYVVIDYDFNYGCFAEETSTQTQNGRKISSHSSGMVYAITIPDIRSYFKSGDTMEFMGIYFGSRYYDDLEVIEDNMSNFSEKYDEWYDFRMHLRFLRSASCCADDYSDGICGKGRLLKEHEKSSGKKRLCGIGKSLCRI